MATTIVGVGNVGTAVAGHLVAGGERITLASESGAEAAELAKELGHLASAAAVPEAIARADAIVFAVWLDQMRERINTYSGELIGSRH